MKEHEIEDLAYKEITKKIGTLHDRDKGAYFHGWFDCLYFVSEVMNKDDKGS